MRHSSKATALHRGFTLTEVAIVLGVVGVVVGAIFVALISVYRNHNIEVAVNEVWQIADNVRSVYTGRSGVNYPDTTAKQVAASLFPRDILDGGVPKSPWNGDIFITFNPGSPVTFDIDFDVTDTDNSRCIALLKHFQSIVTGDVINDPTQQGAPIGLAWFEGGALNDVTGQSLSSTITGMNGKTCNQVGVRFAL